MGDDLHKWRHVGDGAARMAVPGGWIYCTDSWAVFVPTPAVVQAAICDSGNIELPGASIFDLANQVVPAANDDHGWERSKSGMWWDPSDLAFWDDEDGSVWAGPLNGKEHIGSARDLAGAVALYEAWKRR